MLEDDEISPGCKAYWDTFYSEEGALGVKDRRLKRRNHNNRNSDDGTDNATSVMNHYEWFTTFDVYSDVLMPVVDRWIQNYSNSKPPSPSSSSPWRCLHVGCGNSDFADHFQIPQSRHVKSQRQARKSHQNNAVGTLSTEILNVDICEDLIERLKKVYPNRLYAVADCCDMTDTDESLSSSASASTQGLWWGVRTAVSRDDEPPRSPSVRIQPSSVDLIFDKGTVDAILSAFPGEVNPNAQLYANHCLAVLAPGGLMVLISINSESTLMPYFMSTECPGGQSKYFKLLESHAMDVSKQFDSADNPADAEERVETLGVRYTLFSFLCCVESNP